MIAFATVAPLHRAIGQDALDAKSAAHVRDEYMTDLDTVHAKIMALANAIPADKYSWRPAPGVRSISEVLMHVAAEWYYYVPSSVGGKAPADFGPPKEAQAKLDKITNKKEVIDQLTKSWAHSRAQLLGADPAKLTGKYKPWGITLDGAALGMAGDLHEHLGQLIAYARTNGVKPPWSK
jgi:uncharacterized damage-inducible protein DinB